MNIIVITVTFVIGVCIGLIIGLILWIKQVSDDITQIKIELARIQSELDTLEDQGNGNEA